MTSYEELANALDEVESVPCQDAPDLFFPVEDEQENAWSHNMRNVREAKRLCRSCPVALLCLDYALSNYEVYGVWGGTSAKERKGLQRGRNA